MSDYHYKAGDILNTPSVIQKMFDCYVDKLKIVSYSETDDAYVCQPFGDKSWNAAPPFVCQHDTLVAADHAKQSKGVKEMNYKIVVTTDGRDTTATLYDGKQKKNVAKARCNPVDDFDFSVGARLAVERVLVTAKTLKHSKPCLFTGQIVCIVSPDDAYTQGKIYTIKNGRLVNNRDHIAFDDIPAENPVDYISSWAFMQKYEFIEIVE